MFDRIISSFYWLSDYFKKYENNKDVRRGIGKNFIHQDNSPVLKVILPYRDDENSLVTRLLMRRLNKKGHSCAAYFFPKPILSSDVRHTIDIIDFVRDEVRADICKLKEEYNFQRIDIVASSLGVVSACVIANNNDDISNLFFIVPGDCVSSPLWHGIRTKKLRGAYEKQGINEEGLISTWDNLAPVKNIDNLIDKNIFIALSKSDKIIPYRFGKKLADLTKKLYPDKTAVKENRHLGHYLTVVKYYLFDKELLK